MCGTLASLPLTGQSFPQPQALALALALSPSLRTVTSPLACLESKAPSPPL